MERTHREKAVTSIQQGPRYVGARKKIPPLGANCPQTENHGAVLCGVPQQSSFLQFSSFSFLSFSPLGRGYSPPRPLFLPLSL